MTTFSDLIPKHEDLPPIDVFDRAIVDGQYNRTEASLRGQITIEESLTLLHFEGARMAWTTMAVQWLARSDWHQARGEGDKALYRIGLAEQVFHIFGRPRERWLTRRIAEKRASIEASERRWNDDDFVGPQHPDMWRQSDVRMARHIMKGKMLERWMPAINAPAWIA